MSYDVSEIRPLRGSATVCVRDIVAFRSEYWVTLPPECFVHALFRAWEAGDVEPDDVVALVSTPEEDAKFRLWVERGGEYSGRFPLNWRGSGSGQMWPFFLRSVCPLIRGTLEAVVVWQGGQSLSGLRIVDGVATEPELRITLAPDGEERDR